MDARLISEWILLSTISVLRLSQAKTLGWIVAAIVRVRHLNLANLAQLTKSRTTFKHNVKRIDRFLSNNRVDPLRAATPVIQKLLRRRKKRLVVSFDWTKFGPLQTLALVAVFGGRGVPLLWRTVGEFGLFRSQTRLEREMLGDLRELLPGNLKVVVLADRGFGKTELAKHCQDLGLDYLIRIKPGVNIACEKYTGLLSQYPVGPRQCHVLRRVRFRKKDPVVQQVVVCHKKKETWYLMTSLEAAAGHLVDLYSRRMSIEETFRDQKSRRSGFALRDTGIRKPARFDRLLLLLMLGYLLLCGLGLRALERYAPSNWSTNRRANEQSVLTIARRMLDLLQVTPQQAITAMRKALDQVAPNWG
jgi:hypothetical protein